MLTFSSARAIWAEKPLALDARRPRACGPCSAAGVALQVNFLRRFDALHQQVAEAVHADPGGPLHMDVRFSGTIGNFGSHAFDLFRWFGGEARWVEAVGVPGAEPAIVVGGTSRGSWLPSAGSGTTTPMSSMCELYTRESRFTLTSLGEEAVRADPESSVLFSGYSSLGRGEPVPGDRGIEGAMAGGLQALVAHLDDGAPLPCTGEDGVMALDLEEAARRPWTKARGWSSST